MDEFFVELFSQGLEEIPYEHHPSEEVLREYLLGMSSRRWPDLESVLDRASGGWSHQEISMHLLTCKICLRRARALQEVQEKPNLVGIRAWIEGINERLRPVPRPALVTIAVQSLVIIFLVSLLFFRPSPVGSASSHVASRALSFPAGPAAQALYTLRQDSDPERRMVAAQSLRQYEDLALVEPLSQALESEKHPQVRREIAQTLSLFWDRMASRLQRIRERHRQEFEPFLKSDEFLGWLRNMLTGELGVHYPYEVICQTQPSIMLEELAKLASELDGMMILDRFTPTGSFRLRLNLTLGGIQMLERLKHLGVVCGK